MKETPHRFAWLSRHEMWLAPLLLGLAYFFVQFSMLSQYGATWDEPLHLNWGLIYSVFLKTGDRSLLYMMPGNGVYYSPLYFFLNYELSAQLLRQGWALYQGAHVLTLAVSSAIVAVSYLLGRCFGGWKTGLLTVAFLVGFPQFIAHSHYNPKDIPLMLAVLLTSYVFLLGLRRNSRVLLLLSAALFGCSLAAKVTAVMLAPVFLATYVLWLLTKPRVSLRRLLEREALLGLGCLLLIALFCILCWPSSWGDLHLIPSSVLFFLGTGFWAGEVMFLGRQYPGADVPWFYTPSEYAMAMPVLMLLAFFLGTVVCVGRFRDGRERYSLAFLLLWFWFPLFLTLKPDLVRYDGMRQFFFILPAAAVLAAIGFRSVLAWITKHFPQVRSVAAVCVVVLLVSLLHEIALLHPFEGSYRNELVRVALPHDMEKMLQIEYWGATYKQGTDWLIEHAEENPVICVPTAGALIDWYPVRDDFSFECSAQTTYIMFFTRYDETKTPRLKDLTPVFTLQRMGATLLKIYKL